MVKCPQGSARSEASVHAVLADPYGYVSSRKYEVRGSCAYAVLADPWAQSAPQ